MRFAELVLQGVRRFSQMHRFPLGTGFSVFVGGSGSGKSTVVDALVHVLYPDPIEPATTAYQSSPSEACRVALLMDDPRGQRYRLVQDLKQGAIALTRMDPSSGRFAPISSAAAEILQYLSSTLHLPQRDVFEGIYLTRDGGFPSAMSQAGPGAGRPLGAARAAAHGGASKGSGGRAPLPGGMHGTGGPSAGKRPRLPPNPQFSPAASQGGPRFPGYQGDDLGRDEVLPDDPIEIRSQIQILERDLALAQNVEQVQFKLDGLQSELFEIDQKMKGVEQAANEVNRTEGELRSFPGLKEIPADFERRVRDFENRKVKFERDLGRVQAEQEEWSRKFQEESPQPLLVNRYFRLGLLVGGISLAVGVAGFFVFQPLRYVALFDILGFGLAAAVAVRFLDGVMSTERNRTRLELIEQRRQKLESQFDSETSTMRRAMESIGVENPAELQERLNQRNQLARQLEKARGELQRQRSESGIDELESRRKTVQSELQGLEAELAGAAGLTMIPAEMSRKLLSLQEKLERIESGAEPAPGCAGLESDGFDGAESQGYEMGQPPEQIDACQAILNLAQDVFLTDRERLGQILSQRASQYVAALTGQAYSRVAIEPDGSLACVEASTGAAVATATLPAHLQDLVYLGLKFAVLELASRRQPVPIVLDDPFQRVPVDRCGLLGKMLSNLGKVTQVVLFTSQPEFVQHASASYQI